MKKRISRTLRWAKFVWSASPYYRMFALRRIIGTWR